MISFSVSSQPQDHNQVSRSVAEFLPSEPPEKPRNTGMSSLSLLQGIFPTHESNQGFLYYKWIFYQLSYQGSPETIICFSYL